MEIYDVSVALSPDTPTYPGDPAIIFEEWAALDSGAAANVTMLHMGAHTGTHVDAPSHFIAGGARVADLPLDVLLGPAQVLEIPADAAVISMAHLEAIEKQATRVLFKTRNSAFWSQTATGFRTDFTYLAPDAARALAARGVRLIGIDYLSVEQFQPESYATHEALLSHGVVIVEGLDLSQVASGIYELICLPLKLSGGAGDGAPARAVLRTLD